MVRELLYNHQFSMIQWLGSMQLSDFHDPVFRIKIIKIFAPLRHNICRKELGMSYDSPTSTIFAGRRHDV
ncbi:hypothetical protein DCAR_0831118 [Daucus carota subsp. sativus]|uniref:Uncharacterized protein n=1 Tax=Daucus carota subsp. sativus TaxID=79200 RepID=A0A175YL18_DAUCS|nr:hypothetical protein DCAR_0831118 [Daucus carota subsp. sativus]